MRNSIVAVASLSVVFAPAVAADGALGIGPIKLGMTYDELKAATPRATWTVNDSGSHSSTNALKLGNERLHISYLRGMWDRVSIHAGRSDPLTTPEACLKRYLSMIKAAEKSIGVFGFDPLIASAQQSAMRSVYTEPLEAMVIRAGNQSNAVVTRHANPARPKEDWDLHAAAWRKVGDARAEISASTQLRQGASGRTCELRLSMNGGPPRPPQGFVAFEDLVILDRPSIGWLHHSLDGAPELRPAGVEVTFNCTIPGGKSHFSSCDPTSTDPMLKPYLKAAKQRLRLTSVADKTRDGRWTPYEKTTVQVRLLPTDRLASADADTSEQDLVVFVKKPRAAPFRSHFMIFNVASPHISYKCIVQPDYSLVCPKVDVNAPASSITDELRTGAVYHLLAHRAAPLLKGGRSSVGAGFAGTIDFESQFTRKGPAPQPDGAR